MLGFLAGVPGKLKTLTDRLTSTWAAKLDTLAANFTSTISGRIDAAISSRASATDWTSVRAGKIDTIAANPNGLAPIASGVLASARVVGITYTTPLFHGAASVAVTSAFATVVSVTGSGVLWLASLYCQSGTSGNIRLKITIDGVVVSDETYAHAGLRSILVGAAYYAKVISGTALGEQFVAVPLTFRSSLLIEASSAPNNNTEAYYRYVRTN